MAEASDAAALIEANLPLVRHVVLQVAGHFPRHVDRQELARAGSLGLVEAAQRFDESRGVPFDRFAARRIRGAILDAKPQRAHVRRMTISRSRSVRDRRRPSS